LNSTLSSFFFSPYPIPVIISTGLIFSFSYSFLLAHVNSLLKHVLLVLGVCIVTFTYVLICILVRLIPSNLPILKIFQQVSLFKFYTCIQSKSNIFTIFHLLCYPRPDMTCFTFTLFIFKLCIYVYIDIYFGTI
jgi:hypothetical protein